ncbi:MAG: hypothetical protein QOH47_2393 [Sphingomonadales bacterium]|jgi:hypothetical protein|nr:hypothetical protein [Sphingomonadales bacterium]
MSYLALDLSKRSTGWAHWAPGMAVPACGTWELGGDLTSAGLAFLRLHQRINEVHSVTPLECVIYEKPLDPATMGRHSSFDVAFVLIGLAAHVDSYCEAKRILRCSSAHQATWRKHFLGPMKRGTRSMSLKEFAVERCRQLGILPGKHDAAEAAGILDYRLHLDGITPPWRMEHVLTEQLVGGGRR